MFNLFKRKKDEMMEEVEVTPGLMLPKVLAPHWDKISRLKKTTISIDPIPADSPSVNESHFGAYPCIPEDFPYPVNAQGKYLIPLAQINFSECPHLEGFPASGYLQFYIGDDGGFGLDFNDKENQSGYRVLYFKEEDIKHPRQDFSFLAETMASGNSPVDAPYRLHFRLNEEYMAAGDYQNDSVMMPIYNNIRKNNPKLKSSMDKWEFKFSANGCKIGGYAFFTQYDPRSEVEKWEDHILLFQMDSVKNIGWGDCGVGNFFIRPEDLANLDFSKILFTWDCY